jgi:hypothetical protein
VRTKFGRAGHIGSADPGPCFIDGAGPQGSVPVEKRASLQQVSVVLGHETIPGPHAMLFLQDMENIGSPFTSPALSVLFCDISDQVRETTLAATHAGEVCWMAHDSELSSLCPPQSLSAILVSTKHSVIKIRLLLLEFKLAKETKKFPFLYCAGMMSALIREEEVEKKWCHKFTRTCSMS